MYKIYSLKFLASKIGEEAAAFAREAIQPTVVQTIDDEFFYDEASYNAMRRVGKAAKAAADAKSADATAPL